MKPTFLDKIYDVVAPRRDLKWGDVVKTNKNSRMINYAMEKILLRVVMVAKPAWPRITEMKAHKKGQQADPF